MADGFFSGVPGLLSDAYGKINWEKVGDIGYGLLAGSGPSLEPQGGLAARIGRAGMYAGQREDERTLNEARRAEITASQKALEGQDALAKHIAAGGQVDLPTLLRFMPGETAKGIAAAYADPALASRIQSAESTTAQNEAQTRQMLANLEKDHSAVRGNYLQLHGAKSALNYLQTVPGASGFLNNPKLAEWAVSGMSANDYLKSATELLSGASFGVSKEELPKVLSAVYQVNKSIQNVATNTQDAVAGQARRAEGLGVGAPLDVRLNVIGELLDENERMLKAVPQWSVPTTHRYSWEPDEDKSVAGGGGGYKGPQSATTPVPPTATLPPLSPSEIPYMTFPGGAVAPSAPSPIITPQAGVPQRVPGAPQSILPPAAAAAGPRLAPAGPAPAPVPARQAVPPVRPVPTAAIDPVTNSPMRTFPRDADGHRAVPAGQHFLVPNPANPNDPFVVQSRGR